VLRVRRDASPIDTIRSREPKNRLEAYSTVRPRVGRKID
jgi:hypothetical protein